MGNFKLFEFEINKLQKMKFTVIAALVATAQASCVATAGGAAVTGCTCKSDSNCKSCFGADNETDSVNCWECTDDTFALTKVTDKEYGTCALKEKKEEKKAAEGEACDKDKEKMGCAEGLQCAAYPAEKDADGNETKAAEQKCAKPEACKDGIVCGAVKLGASLAALVVATYM